MGSFPVSLVLWCSLGLLAGCSATTPSAITRPQLAMAASETDLAGSCLLEGMPRVLAGHVVAQSGLTAIAAGQDIEVSFARRGDRRVAVRVDPDSLDVVGSAESSSPSDRHSVEVHGRGRARILAWADGSVDRGVNLRVAGLAPSSDGSEPSEPVSLGYEGTAIGDAVLAQTSDGRGVFAFIESTGVMSQLVAVRAACPAVDAVPRSPRGN